MRMIFLSLCLLLGATTLLQAQRPSSDAIAFRGILVVASKSPGPTDPRLQPYEANLRRILRFESFRLLGEGRTSLNVPARGTLMLGQGHKLELQTEPADDAVRVQVNWSDRNQTLIRTGLALRSGLPAILAGPARGDGEVYAVILVAND